MFSWKIKPKLIFKQTWVKNWNNVLPIARVNAWGRGNNPRNWLHTRELALDVGYGSQ